jgi:hypothetical protein
MVDRSTLRVHFPGCDAQTVERLCDEVGVHNSPRFRFRHVCRDRNRLSSRSRRVRHPR